MPNFFSSFPSFLPPAPPSPQVTLERKEVVIYVAKLTHQLASEMAESAARAMNGDYSFSPANLATSCFAVEACACGLPRPDYALAKILNGCVDAFVAYALDRGTKVFVGCVSATEGIDLVYRRHGVGCLSEGALVLWNLCVVDHCRKWGVGRRLVSRIVRLAKTRGVELYLLVATSDNELVRAIMDERSASLCKLYSKMGFEFVDECRQSKLFKLANRKVVTWVDEREDEERGGRIRERSSKEGNHTGRSRGGQGEERTRVRHCVFVDVPEE